MGKIILYGLDMSPPVRACLMTLKCLELPFEYRQVDVLRGEQLSQEFIAKNPQHTVPTLEDDGHVLWDSHAIMAYLVGKYGKDDALYPRDLLQRALVDQRMYFEACHLFQSGMRNITVPIVFRGEKEVPQHQIDNLAQLCEFLEAFLADQPYMAGAQLTIADFSLITTVTVLYAFLDVSGPKFPKLAAWIRRMQELPYYEETNGAGAQQAVELLRSTNFVVVP